MRIFFTILFFCVNALASSAQAQSKQTAKRIVVDATGKGDFKSIQAAINSLPDSSGTTRTIFIRNGKYNEKLYIEKHNIILLGESRDKTIITESIARDEWRCAHNDDWGVATINVDGDDITLQNLTVVNSFGFDWTTETTVPCKTDTVTGKKTLNKNSHQMALRTMGGNRLRAINCHFKAFGGDTVSPWHVQNGMFYFKDCIMEGGVDFYCPRGWAWAENCHFISHSGTAAIWHDGSANPDSKTVLKNCSFDGFKGFNLGRYHRDAQFYIINCSFSENMADKDIYLVPTNNLIQWGRRVYYYNNHRKGGDYAWFKDNLQTASRSLTADQITVDWLFDGRWRPQLENPSSFKPATHVRLKKRNADGSYSASLQKEIMPLNHPANNFSVSPIPYYQTEGPAWENDKVGFRMYLDVRNGKDIFGKTTSSMVMDTVGTYGDKYYHHFDSTWGMDILKVGNSLGAGALALQLKTTSGRDTIIRLGGTNIGQTSYELVKDGTDDAIFRLHYRDWKVLDRNYQLTEEISIRKGTYYYESKVTINGLRGDEKLVTGIVNLKSSKMHNLSMAGADVMFTHDKQSENNDYLGMAIITPKESGATYIIAPNEGSAITNTYMVALKAKNNQPILYRFYGCWEKTDSKFKDLNYFSKFLENETATWSSQQNLNTKISKAKKQ